MTGYADDDSQKDDDDQDDGDDDDYDTRSEKHRKKGFKFYSLVMNG